MTINYFLCPQLRHSEGNSLDLFKTRQVYHQVCKIHLLRVYLHSIVECDGGRVLQKNEDFLQLRQRRKYREQLCL